MKMEIDDHNKIFKIGMKVRIKPSAIVTEKEFSLVSSMLHMLDKEYIIENVEIDRVWIHGFMWRGEDLVIDQLGLFNEIKEEPVKIDVVKFNPENLTV
jgi:hypothetical protein